jgi:hypothetical protein
MAPKIATASSSTTQRFDGAIVASGATGDRQVVASVIAGRGVFNGVGRIVEVDSLPSDPDNVSRDDLVFKVGTIHIINENQDFALSVDPTTCRFTVTISQIATTDGGTGRFAHVTGRFEANVKAHGLTHRNPDGTCSEDRAPLIEIDVVTARGTMTL